MAWSKEKNRMKSLSELPQRSFFSWGTKLTSVVWLVTVALFSLAAGSGDDNDQAHDKHHDGINRLHKLVGAWSVETTVEIAQITFPALLTFTSDGIVLGDEPGAPFETT